MLMRQQQAVQLSEMDMHPDRFAVFLSLLIPLENVRQNLKYHPEGDALFHSLQVFGLAKRSDALRRGVLVGGVVA